MSNRLSGKSFALMLTMALASSLLTSFAQLALKLSSDGVGMPQHFVPLSSLPFWLGVLFYFLSFLAILTAYKFGELMVILPIVSLCNVWNILLAIAFLGENLTTGRVIGTVLIMAGAAAVTQK